MESDTLSSWIKTSTGVPKGSVLGPLLFSLFINDLGRVVKHAKHLLFADDLQIYIIRSPRELPERIINLNKDICPIRASALSNRLHLNLCKIKAVFWEQSAYK